VIDTARTYGEGESEELVGDVLGDVTARFGLERSHFRLVSKSGYVPSSAIHVHDGEKPHSSVKHVHSYEGQGPNDRPNILKARLESTHELLDLSHIGVGDIYHSLHPTIIQQQLDHSLDALKTDYIDAYLLHNPEHYIQYQQMLERVGTKERSKLITPTPSSKIEAPADLPPVLPPLSSFPSFDEKLFEAFTVLEEAVLEGKIRSYGISSNWLAYSSESKELGYQEWTDIAESAYNRIHPPTATAHDKTTRRSSFRVLQFPANLLETYGVDHVAPWAKSQGLEVMVNRPLDATDSQGQWRLASYKGIPNSVYSSLLEATLEHFHHPPSDSKDSASTAAKNAKFMIALLKDLDRERYTFSSIYHYQQDFSAQIMPMLVERLSMMQDAKAVEAIQTFLEVYEMKVREHCCIATEEYIESKYPGKYTKSVPLQQFAMKYLLNNPNVDVVLNGMTRQKYVDEALSLVHLSPASI